VRLVTRGGDHRLDNGLLLPSDVYTMSEQGYLGVDPAYRLVASPRLREEFGNGEQFYAQAGRSSNCRRAGSTGRPGISWSGTSARIFQAS